MLLVDSGEVLEAKVEDVVYGPPDSVGTLLVGLLEVAGVVETSEKELVKGSEVASNVVLEAMLGVEALDCVVELVDSFTDTVTKAYR